MTEKNEELSHAKCLQHARMLAPKFSFVQEGFWHVHWPKDQPHVVRAESEKELVVKLAAWLQYLGRVGSEGKHVDPEYP